MAFEGGGEAFINLLWTSAISSYSSIEEYLIILRPLPLFAHELQNAAGINTTFRSLIVTFLQGSGIPCPILFAEVSDSFTSLVNLDSIDTPAFRSRVLSWAATGSPTIDPQGLEVCLISYHTVSLELSIDNRLGLLQMLIRLILIPSTAILCLLKEKYHFALAQDR